MKAVMISIQPKWCELIANGKKTVEVRKTKPSLDTPFKCYIYCTKDKHGWFDFLKKERLDGKVIGEFVCRNIDFLDEDSLFEGMDEISNSRIEYASCLSIDELLKYKGSRYRIYGWHISNLVIYDELKELSEFYRYTDYDNSKKDKRPCSCCEYSAFDYSENCEICSIDYDGEHCVHLQMKRPPQSWCYVEELKRGTKMSSVTRKLKRKRGWGSKPYNYCCKTEMLEKEGVGYICQHCGRFKRYQEAAEEALRGECEGE